MVATAEPPGASSWEWRTLLTVLGALVAGTAWVSIVGALLFCIRLNGIDLPTVSALALIPAEHSIVIGARFVAIPLLVAALIVVVLLLDRRSTTDAQFENQPGTVPRLMLPAGLLAIAAVAAASFASDSTDVWLRVVVFVAGVLLIVLAERVIRRSGGYTVLAAVIFVATGAFSGLTGLAYEANRLPRLDLAAVVRDDGSALGGFYVTRTDDDVLLVVATQPLRPAGARPRRPPAALATGALRCDDAQSLLSGGSCYLAELVAIPADDVAELAVGPRGTRVTAENFNAARALAARLQARAESVRAP
jgi:hypothetical protein